MLYWEQGSLGSCMAKSAGQNGVHHEESSKGGPFEFRTHHFRFETDTLFSVSQSWFSALHACCERYIHGRGSLETTRVLRSVQALAALGVGGYEFTEFFLALDLQLAPDMVRKHAKAMLKKGPLSLRLYNAYALLEYRLGNAEKGENILVTSIDMCGRLEEAARPDSIFLWHTWVWELLCAEKFHHAFKRLLTFSEEHSQPMLTEDRIAESSLSSPALLLRTENALTSSRDHLLSMNLPKHAVVASECLILLRYFQDPSSLSAATPAFKTNLAILAASSAFDNTSLEYFHQCFARLLYYHTTHTQVVKPAEIRALLAESISAFPQNTIFLSLYAWNEARFRIDDRVRSILKDVVLSPSSTSGGGVGVVPHYFAILNEMSRAVAVSSNTNAIRSAFERAVSSKAGTHCAGLWKLYMSFECFQGDMQRAKMTFYRGVGACPWAKELYLFAFEALRSQNGMADAELRGVYESMVEKEIRIHVDLAEISKDYDETSMRSAIT